MYHGKTSRNRVDRAQKRALRILHNDFSLLFEVLLTRADERKVHIKNLKKIIAPNCQSEKNPSFIFKFLEKRDEK